MIRRVLMCLAMAVGPESLSAQQPTPPESLLAYTARVRFLAPELFDRWRTGETAAILSSQDRTCMMVVYTRPVIGEQLLFFSNIERLQVSSIYNGKFRPGWRMPVYGPGSDTTGEEWLEVPLDSLRATELPCTRDDAMGRSPPPDTTES